MSSLPVVILMTSNGVGMGHLSRQLTISLSGPQQFQPVLFSLSGALPRIAAADRDGELPGSLDRAIRYEYAPSRESGWLPRRGWRRALRRRYRSYRWHPYLRDRLVSLAAETGASAVIFDGVVPYDGLLRARTLLPDLGFIWMRRGMWRPTAPSGQLAASERFDAVLQPGDFGGAADRGPLSERTDAEHIAPVSLTDVLPATTREEARTRLGLPADGPVLLLAPGSGALGSIEASAALVQQAVRESGPEWTVAVTKQAISRHNVSTASDRVVALDDVYPLSRHMAAFDAAVSAAGYNSVHELLGAGVPTLFVPSVNHVTDDQGARAHGVAARGAAMVATSDDDVRHGIASLLTESRREELRGVCAVLEAPGGGREAARRIADLASVSAPTTLPVVRPRPSRPVVDARTRTGGDTGISLRFADEIAVKDVRARHPVEHLLPGGSTDYHLARERTAAWLYDER